MTTTRLGHDGLPIMPECTTCHKSKAPCGRSVPMEMVASLCNSDCEGYNQRPVPSSYWSENEEPLFPFDRKAMIAAEEGIP